MSSFIGDQEEENVDVEDLVDIDDSSMAGADDAMIEDEEDDVEGDGEPMIREEGETMSETEENVVDMAHYTCRLHQDAVYCVAIHPTIPNLILTGISFCFIAKLVLLEC